MDRLYERLTPTERLKIAVAAFGRGDLTEVDRLNDSTRYLAVKTQDPAYFNRLQRITLLALYFTVHARDLQSAALAAYAALVVHSLTAEDLDAGNTDEDDRKFDRLCELCAERISRLKALYAAWEAFCAELGLSATDIDKMIGLPFLGSGVAPELIEQLVGEIGPDEDYQQECLDHMKTLWKTKLEDRCAALG
jgi:hypothetical protein